MSFPTREEIARLRDAELRKYDPVFNRSDSMPYSTNWRVVHDVNMPKMVEDDIGRGYWKRGRGGKLQLVLDP